jgi:protein involved in polysaccharide export with SLBB domain
MKLKLKWILCLIWGIVTSVLNAEDNVRLLMPGDVLMFRVAEEIEMTQRITIPNDGKITYWLLDPIVVTNQSVAQIRQTIYEMLDKDYIIKPALSVEVEVYSKQYINVGGAVMEPGRKELPVDRRIDIMDALAMGRGFSPKADKNEIFLRRKGQTVKYTKRQLDQLFEKGERIMVEPDDNIDVKEAIF